MKRFLFAATASFLIATSVLAQTTNNVGVGTSTPGSKLSVNGAIAAGYNTFTTPTFKLDNTHHDASWLGTADGICYLPSAVSGAGNFKGRAYFITNLATSYNLVVTAASNENVGFGTTFTLSPGCAIYVVSTGALSGKTWEIMSNSCLEQSYTPIFLGRMTTNFTPAVVQDNPIAIPNIAEISDAYNVWDPAISTYTCIRSGVYEVSMTATYRGTGHGNARVVLGLISVDGGDPSVAGGTVLPGQWVARGNFEENADDRTGTFTTPVYMAKGKKYRFGTGRILAAATLTLAATTSGNTGTGWGSYFSIKRIGDN
jgi:hypothetical protein